MSDARISVRVKPDTSAFERKLAGWLQPGPGTPDMHGWVPRIRWDR